MEVGPRPWRNDQRENYSRLLPPCRTDGVADLRWLPDAQSEEAMSRLGQAHEIVARQGWLNLAPPAFRRIVLDRCRLKVFEAGATVYSVGDPPGGMFGLLRGKVALSIAPGERG